MTRDGKVVTRQADHGILKGITRTVVLDVIAAQGLKLEERAFTLDEAHAAREAFITSASQIVLPVVKIDGRPVGNGAPGLIASALRRDFHRHAETSLKSQHVSYKMRLLKKHTILCISAANLGLHLKQDVPSNTHAPSPMAHNHMARRLANKRSRGWGPRAKNNGTTAMAAERAQNLQDTFLNHVRKSKMPLTIFLVNGVKLAGRRDLVR